MREVYRLCPGLGTRSAPLRRCSTSLYNSLYKMLGAELAVAPRGGCLPGSHEAVAQNGNFFWPANQALLTMICQFHRKKQG